MRGRAAITLLGLALLLGACGGGKKGDGTPPAGLAPPTALTASVASGEVVLNWQAATAASVTRYNIYQGESSGDLSRIADVGSGTLNYRVTGLTNGTEYFFAVDAEDSGGKKSVKSNEVSATPTAADPGDPDPGDPDPEDPASPPTVTATAPANGATGVGTNVNITITFSKPMDEAKTEGAFSIEPAVTCNPMWQSTGRRLTCSPDDGLDTSQAYTVTIGTGAEDRDGNALAAAHEFTFTTGVGEFDSCKFGESSFGSCTFGP